MRPRVGAENLSFLFEEMSAPDKARPIGIVVVSQTNFLGLVEPRHDTGGKPRVFCQDFVLESNHVHDRVVAVLAEILCLLSFWISKQSANSAAARSASFGGCGIINASSSP